jgi:uncharacterized membrane protein YkoI
MKKAFIFLLPLAALFFIFSKCEDDDISPNELPTAVKNYLDKTYPGYEVEELESETLCTGTTVVEVEIETGDDKEVELTFDSEGTMLFTSTEIKVSTLPTAVSAAAAAKYPSATLSEAERQDLAGGGTRYEVEVKTGGSVREALFEADGTFVCDA